MPDLSPILPHILPAGLILARLSGIFIYAPILSSPFLPRYVRALLVFALTLAVYQATLPTLQAQGVYSMPINLWTIVPLLGLELMIGLILGFLAMIPLLGVQLAGHIMGQQFGLAVAQEADPNLNSNSSVIGVILFYMALVIFIHMGGITVLFEVMLVSFSNVPIGGLRVDLDLIDTVVGMLQSAFELAYRIAAPILCLMFLQTVALGFISRTAPAFNILSLGFPLRVILGLTVTIAAIYFIDDAIFNALYENLSSLFHVLE